ncbi:MAG: hypothetical protein K1X39_13865, partial [Thermoflexales bacterium]|nr:hypothetical protein [Thermoflexales bacterium]
AERATRTAALFEGLALLEGGAKQTLHYTDVMPALTLLAVTRGGNHLFHHVVGADARGLPVVKTDALEQALSIHADELLSPVYLGWVKGYQDEQRAAFEKAAAASPVLGRVQILHPREAFAAVAAGLRNPAHANWLS